jgi:hypothetical protein
MINKLSRLLAFAILALCSGCVTSTKPVGTTVPTLSPAIWNAKWREDDGSIVKTRIIDNRLGRVEMITKSAWLKPSEKHELLMRMLGPCMIANILADGGVYQFGRVASSNDHLIFFQPSEATFEDLIERRKLTGKIDKDKKGASTGSCSIDGISDNDFKRIINEGTDPQTLFGPDPETVLIRYRWMPLW